MDATLPVGEPEQSLRGRCDFTYIHTYIHSQIVDADLAVPVDVVCVGLGKSLRALITIR